MSCNSTTTGMAVSAEVRVQAGRYRISTPMPSIRYAAAVLLQASVSECCQLPLTTRFFQALAHRENIAWLLQTQVRTMLWPPRPPQPRRRRRSRPRQATVQGGTVPLPLWIDQAGVNLGVKCSARKARSRILVFALQTRRRQPCCSKRGCRPCGGENARAAARGKGAFTEQQRLRPSGCDCGLDLREFWWSC